VKKSSF